MRYYLAIVVHPVGGWTETFGSTSKSDVDYQVQDWRDHGLASTKYTHRKTFQHVPTQAEVEAFAATFTQ